MNQKTFDDFKAEFLAMGNISEEVAENLARDEVARLSGDAPSHHDFQVDEIKERPSIRQMLEPAFIEGGYRAKYDSIQILEEFDVFLTPQNIKSALKKHIMPGKRLSVNVGDRFIDVSLIDAPGGLKKVGANEAVRAERARMCSVIDAMYKDTSPDNRALAMALKILINSGE